MENIKNDLREGLKSLTEEEVNEKFVGACYSGDMEMVRCLRTSFALKDELVRDAGFLEACTEGYVDIVNYLLTSPELKEHANIHANEDEGFRRACDNGKLEIVKYLLTSPELKEHADIHANEDEGFRWACVAEQTEVIQYLIFNMNIEKTENIKKYLKDWPNEEVEKMFNLRELNQNLEKDLSSDKANQKKIKL